MIRHFSQWSLASLMDPSQIVFTKQWKTFDSRILTILKCTIRKRWCHTNVWYHNVLPKRGRDIDSFENPKCRMGQAPQNIFGPKKLIVICPYWLAWKKDWRSIGGPHSTCFGQESQLVLTIITGYYSRLSWHVKTASTVSRCQRLWRLKFETVKIILSLHECTKYLAKYQVARRLLLWVGKRRFQLRRWWSCSDRRERRSFLSECIRPEKETN